MFPIEYKVQVDGKVVEERLEDVIEVESIDIFVKDLQKRWGINSDITIHVWRDNWSA